MRYSTDLGIPDDLESQQGLQNGARHLPGQLSPGIPIDEMVRVNMLVIASIATMIIRWIETHWLVTAV